MPPNPNNQSPRTGTIVKSRSLDESVEVTPSTSIETIPDKKKSVCSLVDELLTEIYGNAEFKRRQSLTTGEWSWQESDQRNRPNPRFRSNLKQIEAKCHLKDVRMLKEEVSALESLIIDESNNLVKYLKRKDYLIARREAHYDVITAVIHAISRKSRDDMKMKFSLTPGTETGFSQWLDAMKMVAQLPGGVPSEFRTKLWLQLSERHLTEQNVDWEKAEAIIFNEWTNPDDEELGVQIVKDLHRTGCSLFCGAQEQNQALLKRVLLAYARWNKNVGYCQGFNMLAALILQVMDRDEKNAVKVMIYLIEGVLPESYFANNLRGLSVDMAVFRDLLRLRLPKLSKHLEALQNDTNSGTSYEPPLTNVFTMQWFLTLFSNCLPQQTVLRVWDLVFLHGNEVLLRTALAIWGILQDRIMSVESADEFYSIMGVVTREMLEFGLMDANNLIKMIVMVDPFPNELQELREKYLYNISPWTQSVQSAARKGIKLFYSDPEDQDDTEDEDKIALATAYGVFRRRGSREVQPMGPTLDISVLKQQYAKLRQRQRQAHIIISAACSSSIPANLSSVPTVSVNHLLMGKSALVNKGRRIGPPEGSIPPPKNRIVKGNESGKREKIVISGETLDWKDAEKRKCSTKKVSNIDGKLANNRPKSMESCNGVNKDEDAEKMSSDSSTSTELCDDDINHLSDFDMEDNDNPVTDKYEEIRDCAARIVQDIEEAVNKSPRLTHLISDNNNGEEEITLSTSNHDNIIIRSSPGIGDVEEEFFKPEPEVPIAGNVRDNVENRIFDRSKREEFSLGRETEMKSGRERDRRKSDLALSVIKENLEMLSKFSQKSVMKEEKNEETTEKSAMEMEEEKQMIEDILGKRLDDKSVKKQIMEERIDVLEDGKERLLEEERLREDRMKSEEEKWKEEMRQEIEGMREFRLKNESMMIKREEERVEEGDRMKSEEQKRERQRREEKVEENEVTREIRLKNELMMIKEGKKEIIGFKLEEEIVKREKTQEEDQMRIEEGKRENQRTDERMKGEKIDENERKIVKREEEMPEPRSKWTIDDEKVMRAEKRNQVQVGDKATEKPTISRANKEVNTDITIAAVFESAEEGTERKTEEILIDLISNKSKHKSPEKLNYSNEKEPEMLRFIDREREKEKVEEDLAEKWKKENEKIKSKIELSKNDWELKMKKIAELESTTREKLNEIKSKSIIHRHRSLDRYDCRDKDKRRSQIPRIQLPEDDYDNLEMRKKKISALSFDEITSKTEKLLGTNLNLDSNRKWRKSFDDDDDDDDDDDENDDSSKKCFSSPTSPEYRGRKRSNYSSPKRYEGRWRLGEDDWLTIAEENGRGNHADWISSERKVDRSIAGFNPFPRRVQPRPKELGVRLGMYPPSPEGSRPTKKS